MEMLSLMAKEAEKTETGERRSIRQETEAAKEARQIAN